MQIHELKPIHVGKEKKRRGRGGKRGTYSGRGMKGQCSRAGFRREPIIREFIKRYPKLRGYRFDRLPENVAVVNVEDIEKRFETSEIVSPASLLKKRLVRRISGKTPIIKILGNGEIKKKLVFEKCAFSKTAKDSVEKAGGSIK